MWMRAWEPRSVRYVELSVQANGVATVRSGQSRRLEPVDQQVVAQFEDALSNSDFSRAQADDPDISCLDECQNHVLEADGPAGYRYVARPGGIADKDGYDAALILERLAYK